MTALDKRELAVLIEAATGGLDLIRQYIADNPTPNDTVNFGRLYGVVKRLRDHITEWLQAPQSTVDVDLSNEDKATLVACVAHKLPGIDRRMHSPKIDPDQKHWLDEQRRVSLLVVQKLVTGPIAPLIGDKFLDQDSPSLTACLSMGASMDLNLGNLLDVSADSMDVETQPGRPGAAPAHPSYEPGYQSPGHHSTPAGQPMPGYHPLPESPQAPGHAPLPGSYATPGQPSGPGQGHPGAPGYDPSMSGYPHIQPSGPAHQASQFQQPSDVGYPPHSRASHHESESDGDAIGAFVNDGSHLLFSPDRVRDGRLRTQAVLALHDLARLGREKNLRFSLVLLGSLLECVLLDYALPRRDKLGLQDSPDRWNFRTLTEEIFRDRINRKHVDLIGLLFMSPQLLRPAHMLTKPQFIVTKSMVEEAEALLRWVVGELSAEPLPEGAEVDEEQEQQRISGLWRSTRRTD